MNDNLMILAAGASSRMKKQTANDFSLTDEEKSQANKRSKTLISIDSSNRPLLDYLLYNAKKAGYKNIYIVTQKENELFKSLYQDSDRFRGLTIRFAIQYIPENRVKPLGTADAVYQAMSQFPQLKTAQFTVCNSDNLYSVKAFQLLTKNKVAPNALISYDRDALQFSEERIAKFALMLFDKDDYLLKIVEKPSNEELQSFKDKTGKLRVSMNIFKFDGSLFFNYVENCPMNNERNEKELPTAIMNMVKDNPGSLIGLPVSEHVPDMTSKVDILIMKKYVHHIDISDS